VTSGIAFVWPGYFRTLEVPLLAGRDFTERDGGAGAPGVIVNETLARRLWSATDVLGRQLAVPSIGGSREEIPVLEVIGVARDHRYRHLTERQYPVMYISERQHLGQGYSGRMTVIARTADSEERTIAALRTVLHGLDPNLPLYNVHTVRELVDDELRPWRVVSSLVGACGAFAVLLMALGLYGVMSSAVAQRQREIGVRIALGADRRDVLSMVVRDTVRLAGIGVAIGVPLCAVLTRVIGKFLYNVTPTDPGTFAAVALLLAVVALAAGWTPARRAASVDPMVSLRSE
jgi:putative ABC transport system permease protein